MGASETSAAGGGSSGSTQKLVEQAQDKTEEARGQASGFMRDQLNERSSKTGTQVRNTADDIRSVAKELRNQGKDGPANIAEQVAGRIEMLGGYLADADADRLLNDVEEFARRQPWVIGLGSLAMGFVTARFLKASSTRRYQARGEEFATRRPTAPIGESGSPPIVTGSTAGVYEPASRPTIFPETMEEPDRAGRPGAGTRF